MAMAQISKFLLLTIWNFLTLNTSPYEAILIKFLAVSKSGVNTCPLAFRQTCVPKNNLHDDFSKDDVNTPSAIYFSQDNNYVSAMFMLRAIILYRPLVLISC